MGPAAGAPLTIHWFDAVGGNCFCSYERYGYDDIGFPRWIGKIGVFFDSPWLEMPIRILIVLAPLCVLLPVFLFVNWLFAE